MMQDDVDETITRIAAALRPLPDVDPARKARVLVAVAAERERDRQRRVIRARRWRVASVGIGAVLAAGGVFALVRPSGAERDSRAQSLAANSNARPSAGNHATSETSRASAMSNAAQSTQAELAARDADAVAPQPVELVFRAPAAHRVSVVGDFNGWDANRNVMRRDASSGLWSQTVILRPGRHVYAFIVDDSVWMRDPRTPAASDADFGRPGSVLLVGKP